MENQHNLFSEEAAPKLIGRQAIPVADIPESGAVPEASFITSIKTYGVLSDIIVVADPGGQILMPDGTRTRVVDGLRRIEGARAAGVATVSAKVFDMDPNFSDTAVVTLNAKRSSNPVAELQAVERVMGRAIGEREIAKATGIELAYLRRLLELRNLIPALRELFDEYKLKFSVAHKAAKLSVESQNQLVALYESTGQVLGKHVDALKGGSQREASGRLFKPDADQMPGTAPAVSFTGLRDTVDTLDRSYQERQDVAEEQYIDFIAAGIAAYLMESEVQVVGITEEAKRWLPEGEVKLTEMPESDSGEASEEAAPAEGGENPGEPGLSASDEQLLEELAEYIRPAMGEEAETCAKVLYSLGIHLPDQLSERTVPGLLLKGVSVATAAALKDADLCEPGDEDAKVVNGYPLGGELYGAGGTVWKITDLKAGATGGATIVDNSTGETLFAKWKVLSTMELI